jgi:hypothetical protein
MARMKSLTVRGGSRSCSDSMSTQVISMAPVSPGEQGVSFSSPSTLTYPRQRRKVLACHIYMNGFTPSLTAKKLAVKDQEQHQDQDEDHLDIPFYNVSPSGSS